MRAGRPTEHIFASFTKYEGEIDSTDELVVLPMFDIPVNDCSRFGKTNFFESASQMTWQSDFPNQTTLSNDSVGITAPTSKPFV